MIFFQRFLLLALIGLTACTSAEVLAPTPNIYGNDGYAKVDIPLAYQTTQAPIFFVTDRARTDEGGTVSYGPVRSSSMALGAFTVAYGEHQDWQRLSAASGTTNRTEDVPLSIVEKREILRFDSTPIPFEVVNGKPIQLPDAVASYAQKRAQFQSAIREQMRISGKNEVMVFVHGVNNTLEDAVFSLADLWHFSGRQAVPIAYSWPAVGAGPFGYFTDRESGEFTVFHFKEFLRQLSEIPELEKIHIIAHSRGTDVTTTALRELIIAERSKGNDPKETLKIANLIMAAPDLDFSVVRQRLIAEGFGAAIGRITIYVNRGDSALGLSQRLFTGQRLGTLGAADLQVAEREIFAEVGTVSFINVEGVLGFTGHAYFRTNGNVLSDIARVIENSAAPGSPSRPLQKINGNFWNMTESYPY